VSRKKRQQITEIRIVQAWKITILTGRPSEHWLANEIGTGVRVK